MAPAAPASRILGVTQVGQHNGFFCGPASGYEIIRFLHGVGFKSRFDGSAPGQAGLANANHMATTKNRVTDWATGRYVTGINRWRGRNDYVQVHAPSASLLKSVFTNSIGVSGMPFAGDTVEFAGGAHFNGHPNRTIGHWITAYGYSSSGAVGRWADSSTTLFPAAARTFSYNTKLLQRVPAVKRDRVLNGPQCQVRRCCRGSSHADRLPGQQRKLPKPLPPALRPPRPRVTGTPDSRPLATRGAQHCGRGPRLHHAVHRGPARELGARVGVRAIRDDGSAVIFNSPRPAAGELIAQSQVGIQTIKSRSWLPPQTGSQPRQDAFAAAGGQSFVWLETKSTDLFYLDWKVFAANAGQRQPTLLGDSFALTKTDKIPPPPGVKVLTTDGVHAWWTMTHQTGKKNRPGALASWSGTSPDASR